MGSLQENILLEVEDLRVHFTTRSGIVRAVRGANLQVGYGETLGLVGEPGSGKSVTFQSVLGLITAPGQIVSGDIRWNGRQWEVVDRGSTNGTLVNGGAVRQPVAIRPGDAIGVGETTLVL